MKAESRGTREIRSADCYSARVSYCPRFTGVSPRYSRRSTTEARMKYERKKRGYEVRQEACHLLRYSVNLDRE